MPRSHTNLPVLSALILALCASAGEGLADAPLPSEPVAAPPAVNLKSDETLRYTVEARVNGQGPYRFIIDTGADRSAISARVAAALNLPAGEPLRVHSMSGVSLVPSANIATLEIAPDVSIHDLNAPVFSGDDLGADGLLGVDSLQGRQVVIDFLKHTMTIRTSSKHERPPPEDDGAIIVVARSKFGQLILVDSSLGHQPLRVVLDTGAQFAVGNSHMRNLASLSGREFNVQQVQMMSVVGKSIPADYTQIGRITLGGFVLVNTPIAFADVHPFERFGLSNRPAMLLGMDMLRLFRRVTIDFANRRVSFVPPTNMKRE